MTATVVVLFVAKRLKIVDYPEFSPDIVNKIWPLPLIYVGNLIFGLGGTKRLRSVGCRWGGPGGQGGSGEGGTVFWVVVVVV